MFESRRCLITRLIIAYFEVGGGARRLPAAAPARLTPSVCGCGILYLVRTSCDLGISQDYESSNPLLVVLRRQGPRFGLVCVCVESDIITMRWRRVRRMSHVVQSKLGRRTTRGIDLSRRRIIKDQDTHPCTRGSFGDSCAGSFDLVTAIGVVSRQATKFVTP